MARRFLRRRGSRGASSRKPGTLGWSAIVLNESTANNTLISITLADAASFATTPANAHYMGTLMRIRGVLSFQPGSAGGTVHVGIAMQDVGEPAVSPSLTAYGQDEDVLFWHQQHLSPFNSTAPGLALPIDVKAKRRMNPESILRLSILYLGMAANSFTIGPIRCLFYIP